MKNIIALLICTAFLNSCATITNKEYTRVKIKSNVPVNVHYKDSVITSKKNQIEINPLRQKDSLRFTISAKNISQSFSFPSKKAFEYWANIFTNYGIGMLVDMNTERRFDYKSEYYFEVDSAAKSISYFKIRDRSKEFFLTIALPYVNSFQLNRKNNSNISTIGFLGFGLGLEYFYNKDNFLSTEVSGFMDFPIFVPVPIHGDRKTTGEFNITATNNHLLSPRWSVGYGLGYSAKRYFVSGEDIENETTYSNTLSFIAPIYYHFKPNFRLGIVYRPSLFDLGNSDVFSYQHSISLDLKWSIKLFKH